MPLSAEQFMDLVYRHQDEQNVEIVDGHRRARRIPYIGMVDIQPIVGSEPGAKLSVRLRDISARGMAVLDKWTDDKGAQFLAYLVRNTGRPLRILCTVSYSTRLPGNLFRTGAEITCILPDAKPATTMKPEPAEKAVAVTSIRDEASRIQRSILD